MDPIASSTDKSLPPRSYYSSHVHLDADTNTDKGTHYSASIESIRAQSLALGDMYMTEALVQSERGDTAEEQGERTREEEVTEEARVPLGPPLLQSSPSPPRQQSYNSNLSALIQKYGKTPSPPAQDNDERQPLLKPAPKKTCVSASPSASAGTNGTNGIHAATQQHYQSIPDVGLDDARRQSLHTLPDLHKLPTQHASSAPQPTPTRRSHKLIASFKMPSCKEIFLRPIECIPAVLLGLLLNLLDAISYGMISFPVNTVIFADFGPPGISMFFVSCIVAQLVYSLGGSAFDGGNGSMMIEVVPFLHIMAERIIDSVGEDKANVVIASTMVAFALSSMMTGVAFFLLGALKLGSLIEFFPRHILVATIGGVGWFLVATGIEVSGRLDGNLEYNLPMLRALFLDGHTFALWFSAFMVAIALRVIQHYVRSSMVVPLFFMVLPLVFYAIVLIAGLSVDDVRDSGWIFPLVDDSVPFWQFYTYYDFTIVDWKAVAETIPAMLALTFFGLLHVPLNVPALSVSTNRDNVDLNRELVAHGISNTLSGCFGSVQNYLVYTNSLLFIRSGGDSRLAGLMLAGATAVIWMMGPWIVGYIPVMVVGSLIFHLGLDLLKEALIDTWNSVNNLEYITICVIVCTMATLGFVEGIFIGILTACLFFVVQNAHRSQTIRATYSGQIMRSTVRRLYRQQLFLNQVGKQIQVIKLQGYLFFGTINQVERAIREMLSTKDGDPIRFLILDLQLVQGLDFSAAEAFVRIRRLLLARQVFMIICNVGANSDEQRALKKAGVWDDKMMQQPSPLPSAWLVADNGTSNASSQIPGTQQQHIMEYNILRCFERLDDALEWCENVLLRSYFLKKPQHPIPKTASISMSPSSTVVDMQMFMASPRHQMLSHAVQHTVQDTTEATKAYANLTQPTLILLKSLGELANVNKTTHGDAVPLEFFHQLGRYFERRTCDKGQAIWRQGDVCEFLIVVEQGSLRSLMEVNKREQVVVESILPGTIVGELGLFTSTHSHDQKRTRSLIADQQSVFWKLTRSTFEQMVRDDPLMANQFVRLTLYYSVERQENMVQYAFHLHQ